MKTVFEKVFQLSKHKTTAKTEIMAGITTFMTMAYILAVNPSILSAAGMDSTAVLLATALSSFIGTACMGLMANLPFALSAGMGLNAFLAYTVVLGMGYTWQVALLAVFVEGLIFIVLSLTNVREAIFNAIPLTLKRGVSVGIGLFICFIGLLNADIVKLIGDTVVDGVVVATDYSDMGAITTNGPLLALIGLLITGILMAWKVKGALFLGIVATTIIGIPMGLLMGRFKNRWPDKIGTAIIVLIQAVPAAVYYLYIQMYGTTALGVGLLFDVSDWRYWVLPVCSMSLGNVAFYAMWLRRYMVDESNKDYVRLALAKGVSESNIALRHIFRNAMVPLVQYIPSAFLNTVVGSIYIESLYSIPGMGGLLVTCVQRHDNTMVQGIVLLYACVGIIGLILGDLLMVLIDPRINFGKKEGGR